MAQSNDTTQDINETLDSKRLYEMVVDLVTVPDDVKVQRHIDEKGVLLTVQVNAKDMGIIIGRNGIMANSIKTYMRALGKAHEMNIRVDFLEPDGSLRGKAERSNHRDIDDDIALGSDLQELAIN